MNRKSGMKKIVVIVVTLIITLCVHVVSIAQSQVPVQKCLEQSVYYFNLFVICYNDKAFCQQKKGTNCWDYCSNYIGCSGTLGKIFHLPGDPNDGREIKGTRGKN